MYNGKNLNKLKLILIFVFISLCLPETFIYMFLRNVPFVSSFLYGFITSGNSIFIPSLPYINILWFLPDRYQIIQFSSGHLIDIIIIINLSFSIQVGFYHYIKIVCLNGETQIFIYIDSFSLGSKGKLYTLSQDLDSKFGIKDELRNYLDDKLLYVIFKRNCRLNERIDSFYSQLRRKRYRSNFIQHRIFHSKSEFTFNNRFKNLRVSCYHSIFEKFWIFHSKNHYHYPKISNYTDFNEHFQLEG